MRRIIGLLVPFLFSMIFLVGLGAEEIDWISTYDAGLSKAQEVNRNVFVLITAPTWCGPCQWMEANTFTDDEVIRLLNTEFVPIRVLDQVDGKRNPDLERFNFSGFPTVLVFNKKGEMLTTAVGAIDADTLISKVKKYSDVDYDPSSDFLSFTTENGVLKQVGIKKWELKQSDSTTVYQEVNRDEFIYLLDESQDRYIAIPIGGGTMFETMDKGKNWKPGGEATLR